MKAGTVPFRIGSKSNTILLKPILTLDMTVISARNCSNCPVKNFDSIQSDRDGSLKQTGKLYRNRSIELAIENSNYSMVVNGSSVTDTLCISTSNDTILNQCQSLSSKSPYEFFLVDNFTASKSYENALPKLD